METGRENTVLSVAKKRSGARTMAHLKTTTAGEHKRVLRSFLHSPNGSRYHFKSMLTPCGEHVLVRVYDLNAPTFIYDETNVRKQHLTSFYMHNFDMNNEEEKQVKAQEKLKGIKRPHQLNNDRSDHASTVEEFETGSCKVRAPKARKNLKFK